MNWRLWLAGLAFGGMLAYLLWQGLRLPGHPPVGKGAPVAPPVPLPLPPLADVPAPEQAPASSAAD